MPSRSVPPLFRFSRNPAEVLLWKAKTDNNNHTLARRGFRMLDTFLHDLSTLRRVEYADLKIDPRRVTDAGGPDSIYTVTIEIKFKQLPLIQASGYGYGASAPEAKLIAIAESLERLGFCLRGLHDAASAARGGVVFETLAATDNTNGACFHSSPLQTLKGAFCELLERDAFLTAWYSDRPLPVSAFSRGDRLYPWARRFAAEGWDLREHRWLHDRVAAVVVGLSLTRNAPANNQWNFFFGSGAAPAANAAQDKALRELLKNRRLCSPWSVGTSGRASAALLQSVESRRILYQRPAFVRKFRERLALRPSAAVFAPRQLSDREFVVQCFRNMPSAKIVPLLLPSPFRDRAFCVQVVCDELQGLDWHMPPRYNVARIQALYRTPARSLCRLPHPLA